MLQIEKLILIAGSSCAGKTFLIEKMQQVDYHVCRQVGISIPSAWLFASIRQLKHVPQQAIKRLVVHYDLYSRYSQKDGFRHFQELISGSRNIVIVTLYTQQDVLIQRNKLRIKKLLYSLVTCAGIKRRIGTIRRIKKLWKKQKAYKRGFSEALYGQWFDYLSLKNIATHRIVSFNGAGSLKVYPDRVGGSVSIPTDIEELRHAS